MYFFFFLRTCIENLDAKRSCIRMEILYFFFPGREAERKREKRTEVIEGHSADDFWCSSASSCRLPSDYAIQITLHIAIWLCVCMFAQLKRFLLFFQDKKERGTCVICRRRRVAANNRASAHLMTCLFVKFRRLLVAKRIACHLVVTLNLNGKTCRFLIVALLVDKHPIVWPDTLNSFLSGHTFTFPHTLKKCECEWADRSGAFPLEAM